MIASVIGTLWRLVDAPLPMTAIRVLVTARGLAADATKEAIPVDPDPIFNSVIAVPGRGTIEHAICRGDRGTLGALAASPLG
jgi:hypothetical protein